MAAVCAKCFQSGKGSEELIRPAEGLKGRGNGLTPRLGSCERVGNIISFSP